jgi:hypothetical protein
MFRHFAWLPLAALWAAPLAAQDPAADAARLQQLLRDLGALDSKVWTARVDGLEQAAKAAAARAQALRADAKKLEEQAASADAEGQRVREEIARLRQVEALLRGKPLTAVPAPADAPQPAVAKAADAKPAPAAEAKPAAVAAAQAPAPAAPAKAADAAAAPPADAKPVPAAAPATKPTDAKSAPAAAKAVDAAAPAAASPSAAKPADAKPSASKPADAKAADGKPAAAAASPAPADAAANVALVDWAAVEPLLQDRCSSCHEPSDKKGGLDVTSFGALREGGGSGRSIVPGEPDQSRLYRMVTQQERPFMPRGEESLTKEQTDLLKAWIEQGASETKAQAKAFLAERAQKAKATAAAPTLPAGPVPQGLPVLALASPQRPGPVKAIAQSPNAPVLAFPGLGQAVLCDLSLQPLGVLAIGDGLHVDGLAFAADGLQLVVAAGTPGKLGRAVVFDVATGARVGSFGKERDVPLAVAAHGKAGLVALGGAGKRAVVLAQGDGAERCVGAHDDFVLALQFAPDGEQLAAGDRSGAVKLWDVDRGVAEALPGHKGAVHALAFTPDGRLLVTAGADGVVRGIDVKSGKEAWKLQAHEGQAFGVAVGPQGRVASCGSDGRIVVIAAGKQVAKSPAAGEWLYGVAFGANGDTAWAGDWQGRVHRFAVGGKDKAMPTVTPLLARP